MRRILVVENDSDLRTGLVMLLRLFGYECHGARSAKEALRVLRDGVDLVITDWELPEVSGETMLIEAHRDGTLDGAAVIVHSASPDAETPACLPEAMLVTKSARLDILLQAIGTLLPGTMNGEIRGRLHGASAAEPARYFRQGESHQDRSAVGATIRVRDRVQSAK